MGIFDALSGADFTYRDIANDPNKTGQRFAGRDALASDISSVGNMLSRLNLGAIDARYSPFTGNKVQNTMNVSPSGLLRSGRETAAALAKQDELDRARRQAGAIQRDTGNQAGLERSYQNALLASRGSATPKTLGLLAPHTGY